MFLHRKIKAHFDFVDSSSTRQQQVAVDIDNLLEKEQADIYVLHDKCMVYVVTFSSDVCSKIYLGAAETTDISVQLNEEIIGGIKAVGNSDQMQKAEQAVYTAIMAPLSDLLVCVEVFTGNERQSDQLLKQWHPIFLRLTSPISKHCQSERGSSNLWRGIEEESR